jgi:SAM-dependent methyltransferase
VDRILPDIGKNMKAEENYEKLAKLLLENSPQPKVLVIGAGVLGKGFNTLFAHPEIRLVETDVKLNQRIALACDAHELPFDDASFDGAICQAVLEHVLDPYRCVQEIHRVLKQGGVVYAETPFMQQVHGGRYDFTRFTDLGHRRLFRHFEQVDRGAVCGPGMALAWALQYFLLSFTQSKTVRHIIQASTRLTLFPLKYWDYYLIDKSASLDAASGYYFLGRKSDSILDDKELIADYKGFC